MKKSIQNIFLFLCFLNKFYINGSLSRQKRLIWPPGTAKIQLIIGFGIPVDLRRETVIIGMVIKANYNVPNNISQIRYPGLYNQRKRRSLSRWDIYKMLAQESEMRGQDGKSCVLRAICEAADTPIDKYHGFFNELFHTTFTPTSTMEALDHHTDNDYFAAQKIGLKHSGRCGYFYPGCKQSLFNRFTELYK